MFGYALSDGIDIKKMDVVQTSYLSGVYQDGYPYSGVVARLNTEKWEFAVLMDEAPPKPLTEFVKEFNRKNPFFIW